MNAPGGTLVRLRGELALEEFQIPGGSSPVRTAKLRAATLLVRFPKGWQRPVAGSYECAEEFIVLEGSLSMNGMTYRPGDWVVIPKGVQRHDTATPDGALALARFDGKARWTPGAGVRAQIRPIPLLDETKASDTSPFGPAVHLNLAAGVQSWLLASPPPAEAIALDAELLAVESLTWAWVPAGSAFPHLEGHLFCRTFPAGGDE